MLGTRSDVELATDFAGHLARKELPECLASDTSHHLADEMTDRVAVIPRRGAWLPPRRLAGQEIGGLLAVAQVTHCHLLRPTRQAGRVADDVANADVCLARRRELGPVPGNWSVQIDL